MLSRMVELVIDRLQVGNATEKDLRLKEPAVGDAGSP
jgi:hypothetical protein